MDIHIKRLQLCGYDWFEQIKDSPYQVGQGRSAQGDARLCQTLM